VSDFGLVGLSLSFGLIFTPSNLTLGLFDSFVVADESGGEVSADGVLNSSREGGDSSGGTDQEPCIRFVFRFCCLSCDCDSV